jgi:plastocyanin
MRDAIWSVWSISSVWSIWFVWLVSLVSVTGCENTQVAALTAEDFRFVPDVVRVSSSAPMTLSVYNGGREVHDFDSPVLIYAAGRPRTGTANSPGIELRPGQSLTLTLAPPPGTYLYICRRKGHANMTGTLIVE